MDVTLCSVRLLFLRFFFARGVSRRRCMQNGRHLLFPVNLNKYTHSCRAWGSNVCVECICELFYTARRRAHSVQASQRVRLLCTRSMSYTHQHIIRKFYYLFVFRRSMYSRVHLHGRRYEFSTSLPRYAPDIHSLFSSAAIFFSSRCSLRFVVCFLPTEILQNVFFGISCCEYHLHNTPRRKTTNSNWKFRVRYQMPNSQNSAGIVSPHYCVGDAACRAPRRNKVFVCRL